MGQVINTHLELEVARQPDCGHRVTGMEIKSWGKDTLWLKVTWCRWWKKGVAEEGGMKGTWAETEG